MKINGGSTKLFAGVELAVLAVPRLENVRLRLHFLRRGTSGGGKPSKSNNFKPGGFTLSNPDTTFKKTLIK